MKREEPRPGEIYVVEFPEHYPGGHEQHGLRPALALAIPEKTRFPVLWMIPITSDRGQPWIQHSKNLYLRLSKGIGGLPADSILLLDQLRAVDARRVKRFLGVLPNREFQKVVEHCLKIITR